MFSKLNDKTKAALFYAIGMALFLVAGSLVYFFPKSQYIAQGTISKTNDSTSSIQELYQNLAETGSASQVSMVREIDSNNSQFQIRRQTEADDRWVLYVTGCVQNPGVYRLPAEARVFQLVDAAGGLTVMADAVAINMAAHLQDGDHLHVPQKVFGDSSRVTAGEARGTVTFTQDRQAGNNSTVKSRGPKGNMPNTRIDINTASAAELQTLPGIGPSTVERIIQYRNQNGRFKRVSDLINISGIGAKKLEAIEPLIFVR